LTVKLRVLRFAALLLAPLIGALVPTPSGAPTNRYIETFSTLQYHDAANTTALWDTSGGEIRLPPLQPVVLKSVPSGDARGVATDGHLAVVADVGGGVYVVDISDPAASAAVGAYSTGTAPLDIDIVGSTAYVAAATGGLRLIDISDPSLPSETGAYGTSNARGVTVVGRLAFVSDFSDGVVIVDVSNPASPSLVGSYATESSCTGVA
jgi:hypothetical protein